MYRLSDHNLEIEKRSHKKEWKPRDGRLYRNCDSGEEEDEFHFLLSCPIYTTLYPDIWSKIETSIKNDSMAYDDKICMSLIERGTKAHGDKEKRE